MSKYKTQHKDVDTLMDTMGEHDLAKANYDLVLDVYLPIALECFMPLLQTMHYLVQFLQGRDISICDYLAIVKVC